MPTRELRNCYGGNQRQAMGRAIRAEIPGGAEVLDLLELTHHAAERLGWEDENGSPSLLRIIHERLCEAANAMETEIRKRYEMPET